MDTINILAVVTGTDRFPGRNLRTGLWLSELTHIYRSADRQGYTVTVASPKGGDTPVDPVSLRTIFLDRLSKNCWNDPKFRDTLRHTKELDAVSEQRFDCVYLAGGHGAMFDFPDNAVLQAIIRSHFENGKTVAAMCHGVSGLLNVRLSNGTYLIEGKKTTGFSWFEEVLAGRNKVVPFDLEASLKVRGADYRKSIIPMIPKVVTDGKLITGQDPFSSPATAKAVLRQLDEKKKSKSR